MPQFVSPFRFFQPVNMNEVSQFGSNVSQTGGWPGFLVVGFSTRALAQAVVRAGFKVAAMDQFLDQDLTDLGPCESISWPSKSKMRTQNLEEIIRKATCLVPDAEPPGAIAMLASGGLETWPELWEALEAEFCFLGPSGNQLRQLRSLDFLQELAERIDGLSFPPISHRRHKLQGQWLSKTLSSSGGMQVCDARISTEASTGYFQRRIEGRSIGVCFAVSDERLIWLGATESWSVGDWPGPLPYIYRGSWGPLFVKRPHRELLFQLAANIQRATKLKGWLQLDLIEDSDGRLWLLEINPRWSAGMEILADSGAKPVQAHINCFEEEPGTLPISRVEKHVRFESRPNQSRVYAKAILYAPTDFSIDHDSLRNLQILPGIQVADIPSRKIDRIEAGHPVLTIKTQISRTPLGTDSERTKLLGRLQEHRNIVEQHLFGT